MANLIASSPFGEALPLCIGDCKLAALEPVAVTSVTLESGQEKTASAALKKSHGMGFPKPNRTSKAGDTRCIWVAPAQALLLGKPLNTLKGAALTDQSDGWAIMRLKGEGAEAVLARLVPVDLRASHFKNGHAAKTLLFHMPLSIFRSDAKSFDLMVFRSMAVSAVHELKSAMQSVAAQAPVS